MKAKPAIIITAAALLLVGVRHFGEAAPEPAPVEHVPAQAPEIPVAPEPPAAPVVQETQVSPPAPSEVVGDVSLSAPTTSGVCVDGSCRVQYVRATTPARQQVPQRRFRLRFWR